MGTLELSSPNQQGEASGGLDESGGRGHDRFEALDGPQGDQVERGGRESFDANALYIDVRQCNGAGQFTEEGCFFVIGFDEGEGDFRGPEFESDAGEAGAGTDIGNLEAVVADPDSRSLVGSGTADVVPVSFLMARRFTAPWQQHASGEQALAEVASDDLLGIANGGEIDTLVPAEKYIDVRRYIFDEWLVVDGADEGMKEVGDAGGIHAG